VAGQWEGLISGDSVNLALHVSYAHFDIDDPIGKDRHAFVTARQEISEYVDRAINLLWDRP